MQRDPEDFEPDERLSQDDLEHSDTASEETPDGEQQAEAAVLVPDVESESSPSEATESSADSEDALGVPLAPSFSPAPEVGSPDSPPGESTQSENQTTADLPNPQQLAATQPGPGRLLFDRRKLPPPTPFEELVWSFKRPRPNHTTPDIEERWLPPEFGSPNQSAEYSAAPHPPLATDSAEISINVQVMLTPEARNRVLELAIARAAQTHQNQIEILAKRLYQLIEEVATREATRRALYRR